MGYVNVPLVTGHQRLCDEEVIVVELCPRLLSVAPSCEESGITKTGVLLSWLKMLFQKTLTNPHWFPVTEEEIIQRARGYILHIFCACLFSNTSGDRVALEYLPFLESLQQTTQYTWGPTVLSFLYIVLFKCMTPGEEISRDVMYYYMYMLMCSIFT